MDNREKIIRLWFDMWLAKKDLGIHFHIFSSYISLFLVYIQNDSLSTIKLRDILSQSGESSTSLCAYFPSGIIWVEGQTNPIF